MSLFSIELNSFVSLILYFLLTFVPYVSVYFLFELSLSIHDKRGRNRWNVEILFKKVFKMLCLGGDNIVFERGRILKLFDVSNLGGELEFAFVFILCFILLFICLSFHTWVFSGKTGTFWSKPSTSSCNFYVWSLRLGFVMEWGILLYWVVLVFDHFILYVSFVMNCQKGRLFGSKSLEQLPNHEYKLL